MKYKQRIADSLLERKLSTKGAVQIEGPKWCGKTTTAKQIAKSVLNLGDDTILKQSQRMMQIDSKTLLEGSTPRLIDEWQTIPALWDSVRSEVDSRGEFGQFILTGSSVLPDANETIHSGTGRYSHIYMRPMSLYESLESSGAISLTDLFEGKQIEPVANKLDIENIAYLLCRGGWPQATLLKGNLALDLAFDYVDSLVTKDVQRVDGIKRSADRVRRLLRSYARNISHQVPYKTFKADILANDTETLDEDTVADYIRVLKQLYVIEDLEAWNPNLRSKAAIRTTDTRHFVDPSIGTAALGLGPRDLINDLEAFGLLFENMAVRDLRVYADALLGKIYHYRDSDGLECDAVLHRRNGTYGLIEIKLGGLDDIDKAADTLQTLAGKIDTEKMKEPSFLMVLTAVGPYAYRRPDGIYVVPIGCLRP
ncbi:MAG: DUF4143 domain-containing protein [Paludibacteraceae bacterium]|nr:DUF4143 domain-containing protein [Paludibacteraceae bacterium]